MSGPVRKYIVRVDGHDIKEVDLTHAQYCTQAARDVVRKEIAEELGISTWSLRLQQKNPPYIEYTDMKTLERKTRTKQP